jgi:hypothetical protein
MRINLGMLRNPKKGVWTPTHIGNHLGLTIELDRGKFRAPTEKLHNLTQHTSSPLGRAASSARWFPTDQLAAFVGKAQLSYRAIALDRSSLRELHNVFAIRNVWGGCVRLTHQLCRDLEE